MSAKSSAAAAAAAAANTNSTVVMCSFCGKEPEAVSVEMKTTRKRPKPTPLCLQHYYTTSAVRQPQPCVAVLNQDIVDEQLNDHVQQVFAEAYSQIQQELAHESARAFSKGDPLAILGELRGKPRAKKPKAPPNNNSNNEGGFMRKVPLPKRLLKTQQEQARLQREQKARMTAAANNDKKSPQELNPYERRKPSRKSIWNIAMQQLTQEEAEILASTRDEEKEQQHATLGVTCSCGSNNVSSAGNIQNRSSEMTKGETWGSKDRSESHISRYQCKSCGRIWNQED